MRGSAIAAVACGLVLCGCAGSLTLREQRRQAIDALERPETRDGGLDALAAIALAQDGDPERARVWLSQRSKTPSGAAAITAALAAASVGDLPGEIQALTAALDGGPHSFAVASTRLLSVADYVAVSGRALILQRLQRAPSHLVGVAAELADALRRSRPPELRIGLVSVPEHWPLSAFLDRREVPTDASAIERTVIEGRLALNNRGKVLTRLTLPLSPSDEPRLLVIDAPFAMRVRLGDRELHASTPRTIRPVRLTEIWLPAVTAPSVLSIELAVTTSHARIGLRLVPAGRKTVRGGEPTALRLPATLRGWLPLLASAQLAARRGDSDTLGRLRRRIDAVAPGLMAHRVLLALTVPPQRVRDTLGDGAFGDAEALRLLATRVHSTEQEEATRRMLSQLAELPDARSALVRFTLLRDLGWEHEADEALDHALAQAPDACGPAREALQHRWARSKLRGLNPARDLLPAGCAQLPELRAVLAHYAAEVGRVKEAAALLEEHVALSGSRDGHAAARVRFLERMGREVQSRRLARKLAEGTETSVEPWFRVGDLEASLGRRRGSLAAWERAARMGAGELEGRLKLLAVGAGRVWERFRPDVDAVLAAVPPKDLVEGHPSVLLLDHHTTLRFRDGAVIHYVHQIMRLQTTGALSDLGEVAMPTDAVVIRAATRKADGRILEPEDIAQKETLSFPELEVGDAIELAYLTGAASDPTLGGGWLGTPFFFQIFDVPTVRADYVLLLQQGVEGRFESHDVPDPEEVEAPGFTGWRWSGGQRHATRPEPGAVDPFGELPRVQAWSGMTWAPLEREARERLIELTVSNDTIDALAARLAPVDGDPLESIRAIYAWVRDGVTEADDAWLSTSAAAALTTGRGERVVALIGLLRAAGVEAQLVMADPVHRHHEPSAIPDVRDYSYLMVRVPRPGGALWLDPSFTGAPFGFLAPTVRGRPAKIISVEGVRESLITPAKVPVDERRTVKIELNVAVDGGVTGTWNEVVRGMDAVTYREALAPMSEADREQTLSALAQDLLPGVRVVAMDIIDLDAPERPIRVHRVLERKASGRSGGPEPLRLALLPLHLSQRWIHSRSRRTDLYADRHEDLNLELVVRLADGMDVKRLPKDVHREARFGVYDLQVTREGSTIRVVKRFAMHPQIVPPRGYLPFIRFCQAVDEADRFELEFELR